MSGARQTTASLKEKIQQAASQRDIELDGINVVEDGDQRRFRVLETDADTETDQVGFEIVEPGGPTGDMMFNRRLQQYMEELRKHVQGEQADVVDETTTDQANDHDDAAHSEDHTSDEQAINEVAEPDYVDAPTPNNPQRGDEPPKPAETADVTVAFSDESVLELVESINDAIDDATADQDEIEARLDEIDARISRLEDALSGLAQVSAPQDD